MTRADSPVGAPEEAAVPTTGTFACPICGIGEPHDHDAQTKYDWANRPWLVRAQKAAFDRGAFEAFVAKLIGPDDGRQLRDSYVGRLYFWKYGHCPKTWKHWDGVYSEAITATLWHMWSEGASHAYAAVREQTPTARSVTPASPAVAVPGEPRRQEQNAGGTTAKSEPAAPNQQQEPELTGEGSMPDTEGVRAKKFVDTLATALRMAKREGGANATMHVGDVLRLIEAFQSGDIGDAEVPITGPHYPESVQ